MSRIERFSAGSEGLVCGACLGALVGGWWGAAIVAVLGFYLGWRNG